MCAQVLLLLDQRATLTAQLQDSPYNVETYLQRALCHEQLGFPDLAAGDAYRALLLTDEILDHSGDYHEEAIKAIRTAPRDISTDENSDNKVSNDISHGNIPAPDKRDNLSGIEQGSYDNESLTEDLARHCACKAFLILSRALMSCGCLSSAFEFSQRALKLFPNHPKLLQQQQQILNSHQKNQAISNPTWDLRTLDSKKDLPECGSVRRELYLWNEYEPDRFSEPSLKFLNSEMRQIAPKCEVRVVCLPLLNERSFSKSTIERAQTIQQLGIFAIEDIAPHETLLHETSLLTANNRLYDTLCDACSSPLPSLTSSSQPPLPSCSSCDDTVFCSKECYAAAQSCYHPATCGKPDFDILAKDPSPSAASNALYLLLLARAIALSETQNIHPLDLPQTKYIWGDFITSDAVHTQSTSSPTTSRQLPFTFHDNILAPLHLLEKMDINIFTSLSRYDTWILNTLFAKFRATASARFNKQDGKPEVCAVHPMWCLANHSCAPNVRWEWGGDIRFGVRGKADVERWKEMPGKEWGGGIKKGEEVLNHYCDVELDVKERREWAVGALGGMCVCERCTWEEGMSDGSSGSGKVV